MPSPHDDVAALSARQRALAEEVAQKTRELEETAQLLASVRGPRLPVLDNLRVASPCTADWSQMTGDDRVRACALCNKDVFNLSELTRQEAEALIVEKAGDLCARYYQRHDGTILLKDCTIGTARRRRRLGIAAAAMLSGAVLLGRGATAPPMDEAQKLEEELQQSRERLRRALERPTEMMGSLADPSRPRRVILTDEDLNFAL